MQEPINHGVLIGRKQTDFVAGQTAAGLVYEVRNPSGDWTQYLPPGEWQRGNRADSMSCVTFSALNSIETQEYAATGERVNYSDRWIAKMSERTKEGNYLYKVADAIRKYGLVKESSYPAPANPNWTFEEYMAEIPAALKTKLLAEGQEWLKTHKVEYEWLGYLTVPEFQKHLKHALLQVVIPGHAVEGFKQVQTITNFFDSYEPFAKQTPTANITDALKLVLTITNMPKNQTRPVKGKDGKTIWICTPCSNMEVLKERASIEGFELPADIPPASSL
jgi:hypothetical protein